MQEGGSHRRVLRSCDSPDQVAACPPHRGQPRCAATLATPLKTPAVFRLPISRAQLGTPAGAAAGDPGPDCAFRGPYCHRDQRARNARPTMPHTCCRIVRSPPVRRHPPHRCPGLGTRPWTPGPPAPARQASRPPRPAAPVISGPPSRPALVAGHHTGRAGTGTHAGRAARGGPGIRARGPVRGRPWKGRRCAPTVLAARMPSAIRPSTPQHTDPQ